MYSNTLQEATAYPHTPGQHAEWLHPVKADGRVIVGRRVDWYPGWAQEKYYPWELDAGVYDLAGQPDVYITQNRFSGSRRLTQDVSALTCLYADLDFYNIPDLAGRPPEEVLEKAMEQGLPAPSLAISSGRGLCLVWQHQPLNRTSLPKWNDAQHSLYRRLKVVGADSAAKDAARVFRLAGTVNSKNGAVVRTIHSSGRVYDFEKLAEALPVVEEQDAEVYDLRVQRAARGGFKGPRRWSPETLWEARLTDLQTLRRLRYGRQMDDFKDRWLFLAGVAMSWLVDSYEVLDRELMGLADEIGYSSRNRRPREEMNAIYQRIEMLARGETVEYKGREWDPRYHFNQDTLLEWLEVAPEDEEGLKLISVISEAEYSRRKRLRDKVAKRRKLRDEGVPSRGHYDAIRKAVRDQRASEACELKHAGLSTNEIAETMKVTKRTVQRWLKQ